MNEETDKILKIITLGSTEVGKTCILHRYFNNNFQENLLSTIGIDIRTKFFKFNEDKIKMNFIDTAGQEKFRAISVNYLKGTNGVILVFDITKKETFDLIETWIEEINQNNKTNIGKILLGNKSDLEFEREVQKEDAIKLAEKLGCKYFEGSAKTGENITEALNTVARETYESWQKYRLEENRHSIRLSSADSQSANRVSNEEKKKCCN